MTEADTLPRPAAPSRPANDPAQPSTIRPVLAKLAGLLAQATAPTESAFLGYGRVLSSAADAFRRIEAAFIALSDYIDGDDAQNAVQRIEEAVSCIGNLSQDTGDESAHLIHLAERTSELARHLSVLRALASEVGTLAINAKIQAAQLTTGSSDFAVFTGEMARLASLAQNTIDQAATKVSDLTGAIGHARADEDSFARSSAEELTTVHQRLGQGAATLAERRARATAASQSVQERSRGEAARLSESVGQLQINDITSQRVEHIREALMVLDGVLAEGDHGVDGVALTAAVCQIQKAQLEQTAADYRDHIGQFIANLHLMASDARAIVEQSQTAFSGGQSGRTSFVGELGDDIGRASHLFDEVISARRRVHAVIDSVQTGVTEIVDDLKAITSIDADMHVMALNATFKCGRLGNEGRALGVIANELRVCGRRTEEHARSVARLLDDVTNAASALRDVTVVSGEEHCAELRGAMAESLSRLDTLANMFDDALGKLTREGGEAAALLDSAADEVHIHLEVEKPLLDAARRCDELAQLGNGTTAGADLRERLRSLLSARYTMASERIIHQLMAEGEGSDAAAPVQGTDSIDDCFL